MWEDTLVDTDGCQPKWNCAYILIYKRPCVCGQFWVVSIDICFLSIYSLNAIIILLTVFQKCGWEHQLHISVWWSFFSQYLETSILIHSRNPWKRIPRWEPGPQYSKRPQMIKMGPSSDEKNRKFWEDIKIIS